MGTADTAPVAPWKWGVVWLLFLATVINYMDRQTVGVLSGPIMAAFTSDQSDSHLDGLFEDKPRADGKRHLSETGYGTIEFAFASTFATFQIVAGFLIDRRSLRWLYAGALVLWSAAGLATGLVRTVEMLIVCRLVLGIGEAFNWPCAVTAIQRLMPREQHSLANGIFHSGASIGAIVTPLLVLAMAPDGAGWQMVFLVVGGGGMAWAALWLGLVRGDRAAAVDRRPADDDAGPAALPAESYRGLFLGRRMWITLTVGITVNVFWHFCRVWLPRYLEKDLGLGFQSAGSAAKTGLLVQAGFYIAADVGAMTAGWVTRRLTLSGWSVEASRKMVMLGTAGLCLLTIPATALGKSWLAAPLLVLVAAGAMGGFANYFALTQAVSARHTAFVVGLVGAVAWYVLAGVQPVVGRIADDMGTFVPLFRVMACVPLVGAVAALWWPSRRTIDL